ncbi:hypothetical protein BROUX41_005278 [Berkeleyomyces rouxiae]|uniref:uncharacterized protein n=1 Tax=Berkeleyomyces rouxiae TaxID=2035830 RepID=UPI003B7C294B
MSLARLQNTVLLFSNPAWSGTDTTSSTVIHNLTAFSNDIAYQSSYDTNLTTISTNNAATTQGTLQGLLYVPSLDSDHPCFQTQFQDPVFLPRNATKKSELPPANYKLIAIAPWYNDTCTEAYLDSARFDPLQGFIFYRPPSNTSFDLEDSEDASLWTMANAEGDWHHKYRFPIYAIPRQYGNSMVSALAQYSGTIDTVPNSENITTAFNPSQRDYIRIWTQLRVDDHGHSPPLWVYFAIVIASLVLVVSGVSFVMHIIQRGRRKQLERRVKVGQVDLEAMGIVRVRVPIEHIKAAFPLFTYCQDPDATTQQPTMPRSPSSATSSHSRQSSHQSRRLLDVSSASASSSGGDASTSRKSSTGKLEYAIVGTNNQPRCEICAADFEDRVSVIRQLPCFHIFHAECIEEFLSHVSCLCPLCRQLMLPEGHCPAITNDIVHRERQIHRLRGHVMLEDEEYATQRVSPTARSARRQSVSSRLDEIVMGTKSVQPSKNQRSALKLSSTENSQQRSKKDSGDKPRPSSVVTDDKLSSATTVFGGSSMAPTPPPLQTKIPAKETEKSTGLNPKKHSTISFAPDSKVRASPPSSPTAVSTVAPTPASVPASTPGSPLQQAAPTKARRRWQLKKENAVFVPPLLSSIVSATVSPVDEGDKSPGTIRRQRVQNYAQMLTEQEGGSKSPRAFWRRTASKMFPTLG